ncbi:MAG: prolyl oligopeptidase family serine peptidase [Bacteroidales bacterium]
MKKNIITIVLILSVSFAFAQKKPLDHSVYDSWKNVGAFAMSDNGKFTSYLVRSQEGDSHVEVLNTKTLERDTIERANRQKLTPDGKFLIATIKPFYKETKEAKRKKVKSDKMPKDTLGVYNVYTKELHKIPFLKSFKIGRYGNEFIAFQTTPPADTTKGKKPAKKEKKEGSDLMVYQLEGGAIDTLKYVSSFDFSTGGDSLFILTRPNSKDSITKPGLFLYIPKTKELTTIFNFDLKQTVKLPKVSEDNRDIFFYANLDTTKKGKEDVSILHYREGFPHAKVIIDNSLKGLEEGWRISENRSLQISKSGNRLFFGISPILPQKDTSIVESEVAKLDIWNYNDTYIQPLQLKNKSRDLKKSYLSIVELDKEEPELIKIAQEEYPIVYVGDKYSAEWGYSQSDYYYQRESHWDANPRKDLYIVDLKDGTSKLLLKDKYISYVTASPEANYLTWYNNQDQQWYSYEVATEKIVCLTKDLNVSFANELHDSPVMANSYGHEGWAAEDKAIFINDRYDVWQIDPKGEIAPINLTDGVGRKENLTFRIVRLDDILLPPGTPGVKKEPIKPKETIYFSVFDNSTKDNGYYYKEMRKRKPSMTKWVVEPMTFVYLNRSKDGKIITYTKHNFVHSPDVWITKDNFKTQTKVTDINPQQKEYNWGTNELVHWTSKTGIELDGILHKPENFDPTKKYPMLVYFYERTSHYLNYYRAPAPSRSTINIPFFVSNEYLVFVPDIAYEIGHPGESAMNCIVPGVEKLLENPWVDRENIAIQGQSWGGYQVAYMITQPEVFKWKAAGAGAPVVNMTSAYGGIRWGSGIVRQFQYEHTQSRIGKTLWDGFDLYIENSPLFFANKIETPLLIMHNDNDGAVPWYQGIEYFTALNRLRKPVWMLQYNGESHNLDSRVNAKDLSIRLEQFFNHYLKGAPMPVWMKDGVPATLKGIDWGYELTED